MVDLQRAYMDQVDLEHRKRYGQFFTPIPVAKFMVDWVLRSGKKELFDPGVGLGAFFDCVQHSSEIRAHGMEIDSKVYKAVVNRSWVNRPEVTREDYLLLWGRRYQNIVCNPPYLKFHHFSSRSDVFGNFERHLNISLSGYMNVASTFLMKSISELEDGGRLAYLMPFEFLSTGYGVAVKEFLAKDRNLRAFIQLECEEEVFPGVTTTVGIVLYDKACRFSGVDFFSVKKLEELSDILESDPIRTLTYEDLDVTAKWIWYFQNGDLTGSDRGLIPLRTYGRFVRGIATGANDFFVLTPSKAQELRLGIFDVEPCVTRSRQVRGEVFGEDEFTALRGNDAPVLLFSPKGKAVGSAQGYVEAGEKRGYSKRYLTRSRKPWYRVEKRDVAAIWVGVFSRGGYKVVLNRSKALNLTCFHGFIPCGGNTQYVDGIFLYLCSSVGREIVSRSGRRYGKKLDKFEPNDLNGALVPDREVLAEISEDEVADAVKHVREGRGIPAWLESKFEVLKTH